ncbi:MAG: DUF488 domain-containing protein [Sphingomonadaceae bacterium]|nr:DUF488 domain-containing protein [Sphingomonadaceae bacterium]
MSTRIRAANIRLKRAYEPPEVTDGVRVLVDRLWPRGVSKEHAALDHWMKEIAPSTDLRKWFDHDPAPWGECARRYDVELHGNAELLSQLGSLAREAPITLVYSAHDEVYNDAIVLRNVLLGRKTSRKSATHRRYNRSGEEADDFSRSYIRKVFSCLMNRRNSRVLPNCVKRRSRDGITKVARGLMVPRKAERQHRSHIRRRIRALPCSTSTLCRRDFDASIAPKRACGGSSA